MKALALILSMVLLAPLAHAQFDDGAFHQALSVKRDRYIKDGAYSGGDRSNSDFKVTEVRIAANPAGYDRIVIQFAENLTHSPFYLIDLEPEHKRIEVTLYGKPKLDFSTQSAIQAARKTKLISKLDFIPIVDADRWVWTIGTHVPVKAEVFELSHPSRIIIDLKK